MGSSGSQPTSGAVQEPQQQACRGGEGWGTGLHEGCPRCDTHPLTAFTTQTEAPAIQKSTRTVRPSAKIMASGPITSWEIDGETVETVSDFIFWGSKITADGDCSHEIRRRLLLGREVMTNLDSMLKSRDITLPTKVRLVKAMVFPVVIYGCESWTVRKAEC